MKEELINDLKEIKDIMNRSSRFISLGGISGISAGILALIGAYAAHLMVFKNQEYLRYDRVMLSSESLNHLLFIAIGTLLLAIGATVYFTSRETKKQNQKIWDHQSRRLLINLLIPLITGGILCLMFLFKGYVGFIPPMMLIFYGLALVNASKYTLNEIRRLGLLEIILGLFAMQFIGFGLQFWSVGFGVLHIVFGLMVHRKYKS